LLCIAQSATQLQQAVQEIHDKKPRTVATFELSKSHWGWGVKRSAAADRGQVDRDEFDEFIGFALVAYPAFDKRRLGIALIRLHRWLQLSWVRKGQRHGGTATANQ
jgi:hypothetical protein